MKVGIMQPYFMPYIGYFQLINEVDKFVIYDDIEYTKKGWINRNRILCGNETEYITLPLKKDSDYLNIVQRSLSNNWIKDKKKLFNKLTARYQKAPFFNETSQLINSLLDFDSSNLFDFIYNSITKILFHLDIKTEIIISSNLDINKELKAEDKVIAICQAIKAHKYINPIGGTKLYSYERFLSENIQLSFLKSIQTNYKQFDSTFVPWLSIIDLLMFEGKDNAKLHLTRYELIEG